MEETVIVENMCEFCSRQFKSATGLKAHLNKPVKCNHPLKCPKCGEIFSRQTNLDRHLTNKKSCIKSNPYNQCVTCYEQFSSPAYLKKHTTKCKGPKVKQVPTKPTVIASIEDDVADVPLPHPQPIKTVAIHNTLDTPLETEPTEMPEPTEPTEPNMVPVVVVPTKKRVTKAPKPPIIKKAAVAAPPTPEQATVPAEIPAVKGVKKATVKKSIAKPRTTGTIKKAKPVVAVTRPQLQTQTYTTTNTDTSRRALGSAQRDTGVGGGGGGAPNGSVTIDPQTGARTININGDGSGVLTPELQALINAALPAGMDPNVTPEGFTKVLDDPDFPETPPGVYPRREKFFKNARNTMIRTVHNPNNFTTNQHRSFMLDNRDEECFMRELDLFKANPQALDKMLDRYEEIQVIREEDKSEDATTLVRQHWLAVWAYAMPQPVGGYINWSDNPRLWKAYGVTPLRKFLQTSAEFCPPKILIDYHIQGDSHEYANVRCRDEDPSSHFEIWEDGDWVPYPGSDARFVYDFKNLVRMFYSDNREALQHDYLTKPEDPDNPDCNELRIKLNHNFFTMMQDEAFLAVSPEEIRVYKNMLMCNYHEGEIDRFYRETNMATHSSPEDHIERRRVRDCMMRQHNSSVREYNVMKLKVLPGMTAPPTDEELHVHINEQYELRQLEAARVKAAEAEVAHRAELARLDTLCLRLENNEFEFRDAEDDVEEGVIPYDPDIEECLEPRF
jgi:uncharacterized C2H2 Zn-finger protein